MRTVLAPSIGVVDHGWMFAIAIAIAGVLMAASVPLHNSPLLGVGTVASFGHLTAMLVRFFEDSLGVPAALAIGGALILGLAVVTTRLKKAPRPPTQEIDEGAHRQSGATTAAVGPADATNGRTPSSQ